MKTLNDAIKCCHEDAEAWKNDAERINKIYTHDLTEATQKYVEECAEEAEFYEQLAAWLEKLDEARKIIWDTSLEDACKIMKLRNLIDYDLGKEGKK